MLGQLLGDGLQSGLVVAQLKLQAQGGREAMVGAGAAGQRIVGIVQIQHGGLHGGLHGAVGGEEGNLLVGILGSLLGHVLQDELLGAGGAGLAGGVGSGHVHELNAQSLGVGLEDVVAAHDGLHGHVAREGIVHEHVDAPLGALFHDGVALAGLVGVHDDVSRIGDNGGVFLRGAGDEEDVVAAHLTDLLDAGGRAGHGLAHHDGLHVGVRGESNQLGDGGFRLGHEVIGVRIGDDVLGAILFQRLFGGAEFFLALAGGAGENGNLPSTLIRSFSRSRHGGQGEEHGKRQYDAQQFLHVGFLLVHF